MTCAACGCHDENAEGWVALPGQDPDDKDAPVAVFAFCPVCAAREFSIAANTAEGYI